MINYDQNEDTAPQEEFSQEQLPVEHDDSPKSQPMVLRRPEVDLSPFMSKIEEIKEQCRKLLIEQEDIIELILTCILSGGHILLEGVPGVAKTLTAKVLSRTLDADFSRIQFTPDLLPSDIIGTSIFRMDKGKFKFEKGPIFSNVVLIDEINRAPAKTQSALFEVMEEKQISYDGNTYKMEYPFIVIATQNPVEQEGTYRLPEAQLDRFLMKINLGYPSANGEVDILRRFKDAVDKPDLSQVGKVVDASTLKSLQEVIKNIHVEDQMYTYIASLVQETRQHPKIYLGGSPRASLAILKTAKVTAAMMGRDFVIPDDIQYVAPHVLHHRIILTPDADMEGQGAEVILKEIISGLEVPR